MASDRDLLGRILDAVDRGEGAVLVTVVETSNSVPRHAGSKMIVHADGRQHGTIGGGEMEARVIAAALETLATGAPREVSYDLVDPTRGDPGVCGPGNLQCRTTGQAPVCEPVQQPGTEWCVDGMDNDCDGTVDEGTLGYEFSQGRFDGVDY